MDNIILNGGGIVAKTQDGRNGLPSDARQSVQYYKDITSIPYPYLYCQIIVREDDPEDTQHPQGIYVITKLNRLGNVDSSGIIPLKEFTEALLKQEQQLTDEEKENVISNIFDKTSSSGLKRKYLKQTGTLTQNDFNNSDTIYVIRYDFDLQNQTINIPENCILQFDGGSLSNGIIVGTNTTLHTDESTAVFDGVILQGSFTNTYLSVRNFGLRSESDSYSTNNGQILTTYIIPSLQNTLCGFYLPKGNYYYNIPIVCNGQFDIVCDGELIYNGENESVAFTIGNANVTVERKKFVIKLLCGNDQSIYYDKTSENAVVPNSYGLKIIHAYSCDIYLNRVMDFAYPVWFYAENRGCCYNNVRVGRIGGKHYVALTLSSYSDGWVNENLFVNGRFYTSSSNPFGGKETAIKIFSANSHQINQNVFLKPCVEGNHIGIYFGSLAQRNTIIAPRCEGVDINTYYDENSSRNIVISTYESGETVNNNINFNITTSLFNISDQSVETTIAEDDVICYNVDGILYSNLVRADEDGIINPGERRYTRYVGYIVDCSEFKNWRIDSDIFTRFCIMPLDENNNLVDKGSLSNILVNTQKTFYYMQDGSGVKKGTLRNGSNATSRDAFFTENITKAFIGVVCRGSDTIPTAKHISLKSIFYNTSYEKNTNIPHRGLLITPYDTTLVPSNPTDAYWNVPTEYRVYNNTTNTFLTYANSQWVEETVEIPESIEDIDEIRSNAKEGVKAMSLLDNGISNNTYQGVVESSEASVLVQFNNPIPAGTTFINNGEINLRVRSTNATDSKVIGPGQTYISEFDIDSIRVDSNILGNYSMQVIRHDNLENLLKDVASKDSVNGVYTKSEIDAMLSNVVSPFRETSEDGFFLTDSAGNIALKYDSNGLDFAMLSEHAKQLIKSANELSYNVVDE